MFQHLHTCSLYRGLASRSNKPVYHSMVTTASIVNTLKDEYVREDAL